MLLDSPPLLAVADTSVVAGQVAGVVLVVTRGTDIGQLEQVRERLAFVSTPLLGYVYNRSRRGGNHLRLRLRATGTESAQLDHRSVR